MTNNGVCEKQSDAESISFEALSQAPVHKFSWRQLIGIWALCLAVVAIVCLVQVPKYATPDDFMQDLYARGAYFHTPGYLMLYSTIPFSAPICALYQLLPSVPWFPLVLFFMTAASFVVIHCLAWQLNVPHMQKLVIGFALICCEVMTCLYFTYTVVAFLAFAAGAGWVVARAAFVRPDHFFLGDLGAYLLLFEGFSLRPESGLSAAVMFAPFVVWALIKTRNKRTMIMAAAVIVLMALSYIAGHIAWNVTEGWESFLALSNAARSIADYPQLSLEAASHAVPEISRNDLAMLYEFCFVDSDVYTLPLFNELGDAVSSYGLSSIIAAVMSRKAYTLFILFLVMVITATALLLTHLLGLTKSRRIFVLSIPGMLLLEYVVVYLRARVLMQVVLPLFVIALFAVIAACYVGCTEQASVRAEHKTSRAVQLFSYAGVVAYVAITVFIEIQYALPLQRELNLDLTPRAQQYVDSHPTQDVLFTHTQGVLTNYDVFAFETWDHPDNAIFFGGYEQYTPAWQNMLSERDLTNSDGFIAQRLLESDAVSVSTADQAEMIRTYLEEHTGLSVKLTQVENLGEGSQTEGPVSVWSYQVV